jgi:hypothetical protein
LRVTDVPTKLARQVWFLRSRFGQVDPGEAYADLLVVNAYTGAGASELWLDDLAVAGYASSRDGLAGGYPASADAGGSSAVAAGSAEPAPSERAPPAGAVEVRGSIVMVGETPWFTRGIQWQGESLATLVEMGFNVVLFDQPPTPDQLAEAGRVGIRVVAPPPPDVAALDDTRSFAPILCWTVGRQWTGAGQEAFARQLAQLQGPQVRLRRPVACDVAHDVSKFADLADVMIIRHGPIGTSQQLPLSATWWQSQMMRVGGASPVWASVQTEYSPAQRWQLETLSPSATGLAAVEPAQVWLQVVHALGSGVRGVVFRSDHRLDAGDPATRRRAAALRLCNRYLSILERWGASGLPLRHTPSEAGWTFATVQDGRSRLLLMTQAASNQQFVVGDTNPADPFPLNVASRLVTDQAYRITPAGLEPLRAVSLGSAGGWSLPQPGLVSLVALTDDPVVVGQLNRQCAQWSREMSGLCQQLAQSTHDETRDIVAALAAHAVSAASADRALKQVESLLQRSQQLLSGGDLVGAQRLMQPAEQQLRQLRYTLWQQTVVDFPSAMSSPLCWGLPTLRGHWDLARRLQGVNWGPNELAAGEFEDLAHLLETGWVQDRSAARGIESKVELSLDTPRAGRSSLKLEAWSTATDLTDVEAWPVWITSAPVPVRTGDLVRIRGWVRVPEPLKGSTDGLLIFESTSGAELAERVPVTAGWQPFTLYRISASGGELSVVFALGGLGKAYVDDVAVEVLR